MKRLLRVQIIILNFNGIDLLPRCLPSIVEAAQKASYPTRVTILDNRSQDQSLDWVKTHFPTVQVMISEKNRFLVSFNDCLRTVDDDIVILFNNDIRVDHNFVDPLVKIFENNPDAFLASPQCFDFEGKHYEGGRTRAEIRWGAFWSAARFPGFEALTQKPGYTFATGFGAFHRKRFLLLGGYDELYLPGIAEDADLGFRSWVQGYRSYYVPESHVYHMGQASFAKAFGKKGVLRLAHRNSFLFIWKNISDPSLLLNHVLFLFPRLSFALMTGKIEFLAGFFQALPLLPTALKKRRRFPKRAYSDRTVFDLANEKHVQRKYVFKKKWKRILMNLFDSFLGIFLAPFTGLAQPSDLSPKKILVVRKDSLGDGVLTLPAIQKLKKQFSGAEIDFWVSPAVKELYRLFFPDAEYFSSEMTALRAVSAFRKRKYDLAVDFRGDLRMIAVLFFSNIPHRWGKLKTGGGFMLTHQAQPGGKHEVFENLNLIQKNGSKPEFPPLSDLQTKLPDVEGKKIIIHIGAGYPSKRWKNSRFLDLAKRIKNKNLGTPILIGSREERKIIEMDLRSIESFGIDLMGKTSVAELVEIIKEGDLFIGNDSGPAHLAAMLGRKVIAIFSGTNDYRHWAPWTEKLRIIHYPVPCSPCEEKVCPLKRQVCLEEIDVDEVFSAVEEIIG